MSLINDMLKDLDGKPASRRPVRRATAPAVPVSWRAYLLPGLAVLCVFYWVLFEWNVFGIMPDRPQAIPKAEPVPMNQSWLDQLEQAEAILAAREREAASRPDANTTDTDTQPATTVLRSQTTLPVARPIASTSAQSSPVQKETSSASIETTEPVIQRLLQSAEQAFAADRLTVPDKNNAFYFYSTILLADPTHVMALQGIEKIRRRYLVLFDGAMDRNDPAQARRYLDGAARAGMNSDTLEQSRARLASLLESESRAGTPSSQRVAIQSPQRKDRNLARALLQKGLAGRESQALQWVTGGESVTRTVLALTSLYSDSGATTRLDNLQQILASRKNNLQALPAAHRHWLGGDTDLAIRRLQEVQFDDAAEVARLRLMAGLLQETRAFAAASDTYAKLVELPEATSHDWLGLAVTLDAQNRQQAAYQAYQNLASQRLPSADIANFIQQRLSDLALTGQR